MMKEQKNNRKCPMAESLETSELNHNNQVFAQSIQRKSDTLFFIMRKAAEQFLVLYGSKEFFELFTGREEIADDLPVKICDLIHENCVQIRKLFPYTAPIRRDERTFSLGLGDRLGVATAGHIHAIRDKNIFPIFAQQSIRELNLTGRTFQSVLDDVSWAVFRERYRDGYGADADHLKTKEEVQLGLTSGYTMITLDCSEHIQNQYFELPDEQLIAVYEISSTERLPLDENYLANSFPIGDEIVINFSRSELIRCELVFRRALDFIRMIYHDVIALSDRTIDFEVSIDETRATTSPEAHYFIASELRKMKIKVQSLAPRFCGEFQKGIDYIGDLGRFEKEFKIHERIAQHFGYRLSIHSGSDKFRVFPIIGQYTKLNVHVKTAGTNWLEAVRLIAAKDPTLYRRMHQFAMDHLETAKQYYQVGVDALNIPPLDTLKDADLPNLMNLNDSRQVLHITYGLLLQAQDHEHNYLFRKAIERVLWENENAYHCFLREHIGKHLQRLASDL